MSIHQGKAIIFCAPSGSGKTTLVKDLLQAYPEKLGFSISACTRDRRGRSEENGKDYYFMSPEEFHTKIDQGAFLEWEEVYEGAFYGTLKSEIRRIWEQGKHVLFDVDVQGGMKLKQIFGERGLAVFVKAPSEEVIIDRLKTRGTESEASLSARQFKIKFEMGFQDHFEVVLVNDDLAIAKAKAHEIVLEFLSKQLAGDVANPLD